MQSFTSLLLTGALLATGCAKKPALDVTTSASPSTAPAKQDIPVAAAHQEAAPPAESAHPAPAAAGLTGTILETMDSGGYTYLKLKTTEGETWAAVNEAKVAKGDEVTVVNAMPMDGFESKTLKRKFDRIYFGNLSTQAGPASVAAKQELPPGHPPTSEGQPAGMAGSVAQQHASAASGGPATEDVKVDKAPGADGKRIADVYADRAKLSGKTVAVRGQVVKFLPGIMGRNWIHLRDGSGAREAKTDDLTVTTNDAVAVGDVVTAQGKVAVDRDFGAGYTYSVLLEEAKVSK